MRMTMVDAKIFNRAVAEGYFKVSEQVEALYDAPKQFPAEAVRDAKAMRGDAPGDARQWLLRPPRRPGLSLRAICESCTYFQTTLEFRPTLRRQRDDAADKGQVGRLKIFDALLERLDA